MKKKHLLIFSLLLFLFTTKVNAAYFAVTNTTLEVGQSKTITVGISSSGIKAASGDIFSNDSSCVQITSSYKLDNIDLYGNDIKTIGNITIKGLKACSSGFTMKNIEISKANGGDLQQVILDSTAVGGTITVKAKEEPKPTQPSENNNTNTNNNNTNTNTNTNTNSGSNTKPSTNTNTNSGSTNTNTNTNTNSGSTNTNNNNNNNTNNNQKTNDDNKKDKANGSKENNLESLSVEGYEISFNKNNTNYSITVNYDVESIKVNAKAVDSKANVSIQGNDNLKYGDNNVRVVVTAENGDKKTYTIKVTRQPDPNKNLSANNNLTNIIPSVGILSPVFKTEVNDYVIYLPYEISTITFNVTLEDDKATIEKEEVESLIVGNNVFKYDVRAENGKIKTYTVAVARAGLFNTYNTRLKSIELGDGKLFDSHNSKVDNIDSNNHVYYYNKGKDFYLKAIPEDENAIVKVYESDEIITIVVESPNGDYSVYYLLPQKYRSSIFMYLLLLLVGFALGFATYFYMNKNHKKSKKKQR